MEGPSRKKRFLFVHVDTRYPTTQRRTRSKSFDSKVRRHLMIDIGKSRRKQPKTPEFATFVWPLEETSGGVSNPTSHAEHPTNINLDRLRNPAKDLAVPEKDAASEYTALYRVTLPPILHALSVFEKDWGEDSFSAYGFNLIMVAGRNAISSVRSMDIFWFPFAFRRSAFLHHYQQIFSSPDVLIPLYRRSARELRSLALERSLDTIQCVESRLCSSDVSTATSDMVLHAVLALVCYNFTTLDFDQAMVHVRGLWMVIAARGGLSTLDSNQDLMLMISWVDITAALLHDTKPLFPLSALMPNASVFHTLGLETLPAPLLGLINYESTQNARFMDVMSCIGDLNALAALIRLELETKGDAIWNDEEQIGFVVNPILHQLLDQPLQSEPASRWDMTSEALRLGAIIWITQVKRKCRSYPGTAGARISSLLKLLSSGSHPDQIGNSPDLRLVRLWLLVLCSVSDPSDQDLATSMEMMVSEMTEPRSVSWDEIMTDIRQMPWVDIFEPSCAELVQYVLNV